MKPFPSIWLNFEEAYAVGEQLWEFGKMLHDSPKYAKPPNWILTYRYAIRAMLARLVSVDREYRFLNMDGIGKAPPEQMTTQKNRNRWNVIWESYAGGLFFSMDSSLECFAYALNALGYLLSPGDFIEITDDEKLKSIKPANLLDPPKPGGGKSSVYNSCLTFFPAISAHWSANGDLLTQIVEYHDTTKHRHSAVVGQGPECHFLKPAPKQAMCNVVFRESSASREPRQSVPHDEENSLQSITAGYRKFMVELLRITREELETVFGHPFPLVQFDGEGDVNWVSSVKC